MQYLDFVLQFFPCELELHGFEQYHVRRSGDRLSNDILLDQELEEIAVPVGEKKEGEGTELFPSQLLRIRYSFC